MAQLNVTELDFDNIKENLKTYLSAQAEFSDYDFEGSALAVLLDALAYNTHYNGMLAHMLANESFIDTAIKRSSVVSIAKSLGYTPRSKIASSCTVNLVITPPASYLASNPIFTLSRDTPFVANIEGDTYNFYPSDAVTVSAADGTFTFNNLVIKEGTRITNKFAILAGKELEPLVLPNDDIDTSTIRVRVKETTYTSTIDSYTLSNSLLDVKSDSKVYYLEENPDGKYQIYFGDGVTSKKLTAGNLVTVDYLVTEGPDANNASSFIINSTLTASGETKPVTLVTSKSSGGQFKESIDSIRLNAPRSYTTQQRAVTANDYKILITNAYTDTIQSVSVWGGEQNDPPMYGKIFISLDPKEGQSVTQQDKDNIVNNIINPKGSISMLPVFVDPEYTYIGMRVGITYNPNLTEFSSAQISSSVNTAIQDYFATELKQLNKNFYYSKLHNIINNSSDSIISVNVVPYLQKRVAIVNFNLDVNYSFTYNSRIQPREMHSTWFDINVNGTKTKVRLEDVPDAGVVSPEYNGTGKVYARDVPGNIVSYVGTLDYTTGKVTIQNMSVAALYNNETVLRITTRPHDESKDILTNILTRTASVSTAAVTATPSKNTILDLDNTTANGTSGAREGVIIKISVDKQGY